LKILAMVWVLLMIVFMFCDSLQSWFFFESILLLNAMASWLLGFICNSSLIDYSASERILTISWNFPTSWLVIAPSTIKAPFPRGCMTFGNEVSSLLIVSATL